MSAGSAVGLAWLVLGVVAGLFVANWIYADSRSDRGFEASMFFVATLAFLPLVLAAAALVGVAWLGGWLLPAVRADRRDRMADRRRTEEQGRRREIDKLHQQVGLPPVDWDGQP